jgi:hypothetical protein
VEAAGRRLRASQHCQLFIGGQVQVGVGALAAAAGTGQAGEGVVRRGGEQGARAAGRRWLKVRDRRHDCSPVCYGGRRGCRCRIFS